MSTFTFSDGRTVNRLGYGAMRLTGQPGNFGPYPDWDEGVALLRRAVEIGVDHVDSAFAYGPEYADKIVGEAVGDSDIFIATKGGIRKPAPDQILPDGSPETLLEQVDTCRRNLGRDTLDLFYLHRVDPKTSLENSISALAKARDTGAIARIGVSNIDLAQLKTACSIAPISAVQNRLNMEEESSAEMLSFCEDNGMAFVAYGPLGAHPLKNGAPLDPGDAIRWLLDRSPNILLIPGTTSIAHLEQNMRIGEN